MFYSGLRLGLRGVRKCHLVLQSWGRDGCNICLIFGAHNYIDYIHHKSSFMELRQSHNLPLQASLMFVLIPTSPHHRGRCPMWLIDKCTVTRNPSAHFYHYVFTPTSIPLVPPALLYMYKYYIALDVVRNVHKPIVALNC